MRIAPPRWAALTCLVAAAGCGPDGPPPVPPPSYDPAAMTAAALKEFDKDGNGGLEAAELAACPGLRQAALTADGNGDKKLSRDELQARFGLYKAVGVGAVAVSGKVTIDGKPADGATVTFTPEACLLGAVPTTTATTAADGTLGGFRVGGTPAGGLPCGLYRVSVQKAGGPPLSGKGGAALGCEVVEGGRGGSAPLVIAAASK